MPFHIDLLHSKNTVSCRFLNDCRNLSWSKIKRLYYDCADSRIKGVPVSKTWRLIHTFRTIKLEYRLYARVSFLHLVHSGGNTARRPQRGVVPLSFRSASNTGSRAWDTCWPQVAPSTFWLFTGYCAILQWVYSKWKWMYQFCCRRRRNSCIFRKKN